MYCQGQDHVRAVVGQLAKLRADCQSAPYGFLPLVRPLVAAPLEVLVLVAIGIGLPVAYGLTKLVKTQFYGIQPNDPPSVALMAGYVPIRALRWE